jgi:hypothetical protein
VTTTKTNKDVIEKYGITDFPALIVIPPVAEGSDGDKVAPIKYEEESFSRHRLHLFFSKHALKEAIPLESAKKKKDPPPQKESKKEHPEL